MKKTLLLFLALITALALAACTPDAPPEDPPETPEIQEEDDYVKGTGLYDENDGEVGVVTDFVPGEVEIHEVILPWEEDGAGEEDGDTLEVDSSIAAVGAENPYYTRTINDEGEYVYAVLKASNNQPAYLPVGHTVVYTSEDGECYYEKITNTYKLDGVEMSDEQYQLHVTG